MMMNTVAQHDAGWMALPMKQSQLLIKRLLWLYFWLLLFEGALRRWVFPGLAGPLLLIREPIAVWIVVIAFRSGTYVRSRLLWMGLGLGLASFLLTFPFGHANIVVATYGLRIFVLHFPLIFIVAQVFHTDDVLRLGKLLCLVSIPMTLLIAAQFYLPQTHAINAGIGGFGTAGFGATEDRFRPPGTFSFILGLTQFYCLVAAFLGAFGLLAKKERSRWWSVAVISLVMAIPLSISRTLFFNVLITGFTLCIAGAGNTRFIRRLVGGLSALTVLGVAATFIPAFSEAAVTFSFRFAEANEQEGGVRGTLGNRFLGGLWEALTSANDVPFAGLGLGLGTNVGAMLTTGGRDFLAGEGEWFRLIGEMGPILGLALIAVRLVLAFQLLRRALTVWRAGNPLPLLLSSVAVLWVAQGNWAQPTSLGFAVLGAGLCLASTRHQEDKRQGAEKSPELLATPTPHGRSRYAEQLHSS